MAASELIRADNDVQITVDSVSSSNSQTQTTSQRVANGNPTRCASTSPATDEGEGHSRGKWCGPCRRLREDPITRFFRCLKNRSEYNKINGSDEHDNPLPNEWWKTGVAFLYAAINLVFTTVIITVVHERVPDKSLNPPLPDKFFDYVDRVPWAFTVTEVNGLILVGLWLVQWVFLKHKAIVGRRCFFLIGTLYMYRCVTMYITTLPVPGKHMVCAPKLYNDSTGKIWRILQLISGGGLSLTGSHLMCGDFLYSGHTVMLTLSYLFIKEYSPSWMWWYHWFCWALSASGVICILVGHEHYSIDVVIAYFVTTRIFWWYHTLANSHGLRRAPNNFLSRTWWNPIFDFLEKNVQTTVPVVFWSPLALLSSCRQRYRVVGGERVE
ncbi:phosphatidylcholine:ceramide cholinephosphotransferase 2 [Nothobranchius furzeri]|uniref:Phosphatidylcholine:ceramide cholinephosphotransferase 2-like n=2 Tax=Nothobranchius furzeri TaxID=105023 RepID=A0A8C6PLJ8_NOTFU|nr:phosphatidylcholine:ceramide cholinephosphotransferase 2-like [Nothobranchius furzeri]